MQSSEIPDDSDERICSRPPVTVARLLSLQAKVIKFGCMPGYTKEEQMRLISERHWERYQRLLQATAARKKREGG